MVVFCSDSDNPGLAVLGKVVFVGLVLVNIWCSVGQALLKNAFRSFLITIVVNLKEFFGLLRMMSVAKTLVW